MGAARRLGAHRHRRDRDGLARFETPPWPRLDGHVHVLARNLGSETLNHSVDSPAGPPQYQENHDERARLLVESGYVLLRDGLRWRHTAPSPPLAGGEDLRYRSVAEVGDATFVEAIASTYVDTRDSWINETIRERGAHEATRADFGDMMEMEHVPDWWELAYTSGGELVGVVMGARNPSSAVLAYIGVVPEYRGRGYSSLLVRRGTEQLRRSSVDEIRADCDLENVAMVRAFTRAGYTQMARRKTFRIPL